VRALGKPHGHLQHAHFVNESWSSVLKDTFDSVFAGLSLSTVGILPKIVYLEEEDTYFENANYDEESKILLDIAVTTVVATVSELDLYSLGLTSNPWAFNLLPSLTAEQQAGAMSAIRKEWSTVLEWEAKRPGWLSKAAPHTATQHYREVMTVESSVAASPPSRNGS
jgi:hypothetical protein